MINKNKKGNVLIEYVVGVIIFFGALGYFIGQSGWGAVIVTLGVFIELLYKKLVGVMG